MRLAEDLDAYAHAVAHDLKSPVSIINGYSDLLELAIQQGDLTGAGELVSRIVNGCDTMTENIEELLLLASVRRLDEVVMDRLDMTGIVCQVLER
jgi:signal transduction histidine kinase